MKNRKILTPEERNQRVDEIQKEAGIAWVKANGIGAVKMCTGIGKTILGIKCLYVALKKGWINKGDTVRFWAETIAAEGTFFIDERDAVIRLMGEQYDFTKDFNCIFRCYQSGIDDTDVAFEFYDEIDESMTKTRYTVVSDSKARCKYACSATNSDKISVFRDDIDASMLDKVRQSDKATEKGQITNFINKGQLLEVLLPTVYEYNLDQAVEEGVLSRYETIIIKHKLDNTKTYVETGKGKKVKKYTEQKLYDLAQYILNAKEERGGFDVKKYPEPVRKAYMMKASSLLFNAKSKVPVAKALRYLLGDRKVLIFAQRLDILEDITEYVVGKDNVDELIEKFNSGENKTIASCKMLKRRISLHDPQDMIIVSFNSTSTELEQMLGRMLRYSYGKTRRVYIIVTENTWEEKWFKEFTQVLDSRGKVVREMDLNIVKTVTSKQVVEQANKKLAESKTIKK